MIPHTFPNLDGFLAASLAPQQLVAVHLFAVVKDQEYGLVLSNWREDSVFLWADDATQSLGENHAAVARVVETVLGIHLEINKSVYEKKMDRYITSGDVATVYGAIHNSFPSSGRELFCIQLALPSRRAWRGD